MDSITSDRLTGFRQYIDEYNDRIYDLVVDIAYGISPKDVQMSDIITAFCAYTSYLNSINK